MSWTNSAETGLLDNAAALERTGRREYTASLIPKEDAP
jgi:hypothetical protein